MTNEENQIEAALSLKRAIQKHKKHFRSPVCMGKFTVVGIFLGAALLVKRLQPDGHSYVLMGYPCGVTIGIILTLIWTVFFDKKQKKQRADYKNALLEMTKSNDVNAVGLLLEEAYHYDFALRQEIRGALMRLLPRLQTENAPVINSEQRKGFGASAVHHRRNKSEPAPCRTTGDSADWRRGVIAYCEEESPLNRRGIWNGTSRAYQWNSS